MLGTKVRTKQYEEIEGGLGWGGKNFAFLPYPPLHDFSALFPIFAPNQSLAKNGV